MGDTFMLTQFIHKINFTLIKKVLYQTNKILINHKLKLSYV